MIFVSSHLIINGLSAAIVTVPPLRGRLGGGCSDYVVLGFMLCGAGVNIRSNMFLPFGKVRMGLSLGWVILWVGQDEY